MNKLDNRALQDLICEAAIAKIRNFKSKKDRMPFHERLLGKEFIDFYSFFQSFYTTFGTNIFENIAQLIAQQNFDNVQKQYKLEGQINDDATIVISELINDLNSKTRDPNYRNELSLIRDAVKKGNHSQLATPKVDLYLESDKGKHLFDLKTVKPNKSGIASYKKQILEWACSCMCKDLEAEVQTCIAIPYNPWDPEPYKWWPHMILDQEDNSQIIIGRDFWNFLAGGQDIYDELLDVFERAGEEIQHTLKNWITSTFFT